jgi:hypothetical protein
MIRRMTRGNTSDDITEEIGNWLAGIVICISLMGDMSLNWVLSAAAHNFGGLPEGRDTPFIATYLVFTITMLLPLTST